MRRGFGLIQALMIIILVGGILAIAMKYGKVSAKQTGDIYVREAAELFMNSAVELTLLAISGYERNATTKCLHEVHITSPDQRFTADVNITKYFLFKDEYCDERTQIIDTEDSHGMVMLEVVVNTNPSHERNKGKRVRLTRRTLQRP